MRKSVMLGTSGSGSVAVSGPSISAGSPSRTADSCSETGSLPFALYSGIAPLTLTAVTPTMARRDDGDLERRAIVPVARVRVPKKHREHEEVVDGSLGCGMGPARCVVATAECASAIGTRVEGQHVLLRTGDKT
eukprot:3312784-Prymnesium_polylepis.2